MAPAARNKQTQNSKVKKNATSRGSKNKRKTDHDDDRLSERSNLESEEDVPSDSEEEAVELDSDALDDESDEGASSSKKRKRVRAAVKRKSPSKKRKKPSPEDQSWQSGEENEFCDAESGGEGLTIVGNVVQAPTEGRVPPGQISQNTVNFLKNLAKPECNDREWFKLHEPVYRLAEKEWIAWIETFTPLLIEIDDQIPELPPRDVIHRIYRDIRFSNDKTPYKQGFSVSFSRTGRKGIFAHYHIAVIPNGRSIVAAGAWQPGKNELATMRSHIKRNSTRLRKIISNPEFVKFFGKPTPHPNRERQNIFGAEDELKTAPKGVPKDHKDIDLLKLRSVAVIHRFLDSEVLAPDFMEQVCKVVKVMRPLVHCLNDMMTLPPDDSDTEDASE